MPRQQQYYQDPARYFTEKEARRDQGFRDILNMMMMKKQQERDRAKEEWEKRFKEKEFALKEKTFATEGDLSKKSMALRERDIRRLENTAKQAQLNFNKNYLLDEQKIRLEGIRANAYAKSVMSRGDVDTSKDVSDYRNKIITTRTNFAKKRADVIAKFGELKADAEKLKAYDSSGFDEQKELALRAIDEQEKKTLDMLRSMYGSILDPTGAETESAMGVPTEEEIGGMMSSHDRMPPVLRSKIVEKGEYKGKKAVEVEIGGRKRWMLYDDYAAGMIK